MPALKNGELSSETHGRYLTGAAPVGFQEAKCLSGAREEVTVAWPCRPGLRPPGRKALGQGL